MKMAKGEAGHLIFVLSSVHPNSYRDLAFCEPITSKLGHFNQSSPTPLN